MKDYVDRGQHTIQEVRQKNEHTLIKVNYKGFTWDVDASIFYMSKKKDILNLLHRYFEKQMNEMITDIMRLQRNHERYRERIDREERCSYREYDNNGDFIGYYKKHKKHKRRRNGSR